MEADRKAKGMPFYGDMEEELEKEMYDIWDWKMMRKRIGVRFFVVDKYFTTCAAV